MGGNARWLHIRAFKGLEERARLDRLREVILPMGRRRMVGGDTIDLQRELGNCFWISACDWIYGAIWQNNFLTNSSFIFTPRRRHRR